MKILLDELTNKNRKGVTLNCFSPLVMIITFAIEISLAVYTFIKSRKAKSDVGIVIVLVFLATFQLSEYQICDGKDALLWSRIGLFAITFLPVMGVYLISKLKKEAKLLKIGFAIAIAFAIFFVFIPKTINGATCGGNYIIFDIKSSIHSLYGYYYLGFLFIGIIQAFKGMQNEENKKSIKKALKWFIIGYLSFILPLTLVYIIIPITRVAVTSIMCGFAVIFAFIITFKIAPIYHENIKLKNK
ncbi:MAG: hypothetical protein PHD02_00805 [Bacilli bacterium]|nr:hypothetical protein [Bacilli bacterium]